MQNDHADRAAFASFGAVLTTRAAAHPEREGRSFLADSGEVSERVTYAQMNGKARSIAHALSGTATGERALLLFPPGMEFVAAL
jgi:acyl-CoA synthetase (AMP-forming)/AMP-acid ligase II